MNSLLQSYRSETEAESGAASEVAEGCFSGIRSVAGLGLFRMWADCEAFVRRMIAEYD